MGTRSAEELASEHQNSSAGLEQQTDDFAAQGAGVVYQIADEYFTYLHPETVDFGSRHPSENTHQLPSGTTPREAFAKLRADAIQATIARLESVSNSATVTQSEQATNPAAIDQSEQESTEAIFSESDKMAGENDDEIPWVSFPPRPEGWKGEPGNPNFKALGTLSPPVMRQIEPAGPHFLAFARRVSFFWSRVHLCLLTHSRSVMAAHSPKMSASKPRARRKKSRLSSLM